MTLSNTLTLAQLHEMEIQEVSKLPADQIATLLDAVEDMKAKAKSLDARLQAALMEKYGADAAALRKAKGTDTGRVSLVDDGCTIRADLPKVVEWSQASLAVLYVHIKEVWKGDPDEYIDRKLSVSETKYNAWPSELREHFTPARLVKSGKPSFKIEKGSE